MQAKNEEAVTHLLNDVVEFARGRLPEPTFKVVEPFLRHYYDFVDADDLQSRSICGSVRCGARTLANGTALHARRRTAARL